MYIYAGKYIVAETEGGIYLSARYCYFVVTPLRLHVVPLCVSWYFIGLWPVSAGTTKLGSLVVSSHLIANFLPKLRSLDVSSISSQVRQQAINVYLGGGVLFFNIVINFFGLGTQSSDSVDLYICTLLLLMFFFYLTWLL